MAVNCARIRMLSKAAWLAAVLSLAACRQSPLSISVQVERSPVAGAGVVPQLTRLHDGRILLSWQKPLPAGGYSFEMAVQEASEWSGTRTISSGPNLSMFTADLPAVAELPGGSLLAYWELKDARDGDPYATTIQTAISTDEGRTWSKATQPYGEAFSGQHSFLSWFPSKDGIGLLWLDANERSKARYASVVSGSPKADSNLGSIGLRYAALNANGEVTHEAFVDPITCECCPTSAAVTARGPVVAYRGRQEPAGTRPSEVRADRPTVRDIYLTRLEANGWTKPHLVHNDNWVINACPDNGPSVDAIANHLAVAWWTRSNDDPKVQVTFSQDSGDTFGQAIRVDSGKAEGQVTLALLQGGKAAIVGFLEEGQTWARYLTATGSMSPAVSLGPSPRHSRLPKWIADGNRSVVAVWTTKQNELPRINVSRIRW